jgi:hypothetical protein
LAETVVPNSARFFGRKVERSVLGALAVENGLVGGNVTGMEGFDPIDLNYLAIYRATALDRVEIIKGGVKASVAKRIVADLGMPAALPKGAKPPQCSAGRADHPHPANRS